MLHLCPNVHCSYLHRSTRRCALMSSFMQCLSVLGICSFQLRSCQVPRTLQCTTAKESTAKLCATLLLCYFGMNWYTAQHYVSLCIIDLIHAHPSIFALFVCSFTSTPACLKKKNLCSYVYAKVNKQ